MSLSALPYELLCDILRDAIDIHPRPHAIPRVSSFWRDISLPILHSNIKLLSHEKLRLFSTYDEDEVAGAGSMNGFKLSCSPGGRVVEIRLPGGTPSTGVWMMIMKALRRCEHAQSRSQSSGEFENGGRCCRGVRILRLCLNSHLSDPDIHLVGPALRQINPENFQWRGPDPDHHFSTAVRFLGLAPGLMTITINFLRPPLQIVPTAAAHVCTAIRHWDNLRTLDLSNISFLNEGRELVDALLHLAPINAASHSCQPVNLSMSIQGNSYLDLTINQAVFMHPISVVLLVLGQPALRSIRLVDVYQHSIWGPRLRLQDIERHLLSISAELDHLTELEKLEWVQTIRKNVRCFAKTERLMGGDREVN